MKHYTFIEVYTEVKKAKIANLKKVVINVFKEEPKKGKEKLVYQIRDLIELEYKNDNYNINYDVMEILA